MTDLTVLYIPNALPATPPTQTGLGLSLAFPRARRTPPRLPFASTPMVTLEMVDLPTPTSDQHVLYRQPISPVRTRDHSLLSPPPNSFTSRPRRRPHPTSDRSVPPRPASAPPLPPPRSAPLTPSTTTRFSFDASGGIGVFEHPTPRRIPPSPYRERAPSELVRPAPPLCRPKTFWRHTSRSGVTASAYSPSSHLVRRATFVAAGRDRDVASDKPPATADLSALCLAARISVVLLPPLPPLAAFS
ncbi:hypothetical protein HETIRDRAFT_455253 [Heterobasidion irregulare TC 32-1]|uniref:Uncharacterized protein n=1 Tax=Heterobasidion irregulare (strain TC 32-1) TaxID=747525 RepID=W4JUQ7_HETIT|nr:uncharacterized protein HETIRDRAFT_455253 [Heterobasidion irregulare TC 32-1]ETW76800.1 hypothetical protein HETIRDRAFT_455253 [Heterobasidion irregulare TC 32-1]